MAGSGYTTTSALADSLPTIRASARIVREFEGVMPQLVSKETLGEGVGNDWSEVTYAALTATAVSETTVFDNYQQLSDTLLTITPTVVGIVTLVTDRVKHRITKNGLAKIGSLGQNAMQRKKDEDGITVLDGATTALAGAGTTLTSGHIAAASYRITSNTTEPGHKPIRCVLHGFQMKDLFDELVAGVGTYNVPEGPSARVFQTRYDLPIAGCEIYEDGNITRDSELDCKGGVFAQEAIVLVQGRAPRIIPQRREDVGGGAEVIYHYDEYAYGERSAGNWLYEIYSDAANPTS